MADPAAPGSSSLARHLASLYPLARVLAGAEEAESLVERIYERAAEVPPQQRPDDERAWLFQLMMEVRDGSLRSTGAEVDPAADTSFTDDPFRRRVATQTAERKLPVAFAACSIQERFLLAIDVLADPSDQLLAAALDTTAADARSMRDRARSTLRASLRDVLNGPERMLVDVALPAEALRHQLRELLTEWFQPPPSSLKARVARTLEAAATRRSDADEADAEPKTSLLRAVWAPLRRMLSSRVVLALVLGAVFVAGGIGGLSYFSSSAPAPRKVIELSVERALNVETDLRTESPSEATAFVRRTWNRRLSVPSLEGATLQGVGRLAVGDQTEVPALLYTDDETGTRIVACAFNYALVDRLGDRLTLAADLRAELAANDAPLAQRHSERAVVLWRQRDDILVLVAPEGDPDRLRARLPF